MSEESAKEMDSEKDSTARMADFIRNEALHAGFEAVGFARLGPSRSLARLEQWLAEGLAGEMTYLARHLELRADPRELAPGARSLIALAARYPVNPQPGVGFSSYARGLDYHNVFRRKLKKLAGTLRDEYGCRCARICVDSAPLLEREWAQAAGLGWIGKQGQLIHPELGACLLLAFLLVDSEVPPSPPVPPRCGDCTRCLDACPTQALRGDGTMDARRCISYLTIEAPGEIPSEFKAAVAGALFGCDRCTAICPFNQPKTAGVLPDFEETTPCPTAREILEMDETAFDARFKGTTVKRSGLERLKRNARLAVQYGEDGPS